jgi:hypothetical protein
MIPGVKIVLGSGSGPTQTVYYFRSDVSNSGLQASGFLKFAATLGNGNGLIKSASYLMHSGNFSHIRDFIMGHSQYIVQDDSGIPLAAFRPETWSFQPYGAYLGPIAIFPGRSQPRLGELFKKAKAPPLDFGIGYRHRGHDSNLLLAVRKDQLKMGSPQTTQAAPATTTQAAPAPATQQAAPAEAPAAVPPATTQTAPPLRGMASDDRAPAPAEKQE